MKQHITPKQAKQLTESQFYSLFKEIVPRKDWANYHHKKVTIGKIMEVLQDSYILNVATINRSWRVLLFSLNGSLLLHESNHKELIDALFESLLWNIQSSNN